MYKTILLPVDLGEDQTQIRATEAAVDLAKSTGASLHVVTVVPDFGMPLVGSFFPEGFEKKAFDAAKEQLAAFVAARVPGDLGAKQTVPQGTIYERILATAKDIGADLIVVGSHSPELKDYLIGPNSARVVRHADCSVLLVR